MNAGENIFRLSRTVFYHVVNRLMRYIYTKSTPNAHALSAICTNSPVIFETCNVISHILGPKYRFLPRNEEDMRTYVAEFDAKYGMIQAFGCIDRTHIPILRLVECSQYNYSYTGIFLFECIDHL